MEAAPICPNGGGVYREATEAELHVAYREQFGDGPPEPIATINLHDKEAVERANAALNPEALNRFFGPGGEGMAAFEKALKGETE